MPRGRLLRLLLTLPQVSDGRHTTYPNLLILLVYYGYAIMSNYLAEAVRFELTIQLPVCLLSRQMPSATRPRFQYNKSIILLQVLRLLQLPVHDMWDEILTL